MNLGKLELEQLSEGNYLLGNNGFIQRWRPEQEESKFSSYAEQMPFYKVVGIDPLLVKIQDNYVLLDAGLGLQMNENDRDESFSNLITNLEVLGVDPSKISHVIVSHLHRDHIGGLVYDNKKAQTTPTLPNAEIIVQRLEFQYALEQFENPEESSEAGYALDDFFRLVSDGRVRFIEDEYQEILPGIETIRTGGHTPGHQIVRLTSEGKSAFFVGDLVFGNHRSLHRYDTKDVDFDPISTKYLRSFWLKTAYDLGAWVFFYHATEKKYGQLVRSRLRRFMLKSE